jgi:hypothetical protein
MRKMISLLILVFSLHFVNAQNDQQDSAWLRDHYTKLEKYIPMRDGIKLFTAIYVTLMAPIIPPAFMQPIGDTMSGAIT